MHEASPHKRAKVSAEAAAIVATVTGEPALLHNIIRFIPSSDAESNTTSKSAAVLQAIGALCRAIPGLSRAVGPTNEAFWRNMVLAHFDFATSAFAVNVEDWGGDFYNDDDRVDDECDDPEFADWHRHPKNGPHREWMRDHPAYLIPEPSANADPDVRNAADDFGDGNADDDSDDCNRSENGEEFYPEHFLVDGMAFWPALQTYFKPKAYGFLEKIQQDRSLLEALWPDHEDAFSLFCDLLLLRRFESTKAVEWETWSDSFQPVHPCLLGRFPTKIVGRGFAMLKFCDFVPCFWTGMDNNNSPDKAVSDRWSGLDGPLPPTDCKWKALRAQRKEAAAQRRLHETGSVENSDIEVVDNDDRFVDHDECVERTEEERSIFPGARSHQGHPFWDLRQFVHETFSDWRRVHISQGENASPEFYVGPTKRSGRWMGFFGQSDYSGC